MERSHKAGLGFGVTSGIITPLGLMVGLYSGTQSALIIIGGILTIAIADSLSDSLGIHISKESVTEYSVREVWEATISTFLAKFFIALFFVIPFLCFDVNVALVLSIILGAAMLAGFSFYIARKRNANPWHAIFEHLLIASLVIVLTYYLPYLIRGFLV